MFAYAFHPIENCIHTLQLDNLLLLAGPRHEVRLVDFGWSCANTDDACCCTTLSGTPEYVAPEVSHCLGFSKPVCPRMPRARCCSAAVPKAWPFTVSYKLCCVNAPS